MVSNLELARQNLYGLKKVLQVNATSETYSARRARHEHAREDSHYVKRSHPQSLNFHQPPADPLGGSLADQNDSLPPPCRRLECFARISESRKTVSAEFPDSREGRNSRMRSKVRSHETPGAEFSALSIVDGLRYN